MKTSINGETKITYSSGKKSLELTDTDKKIFNMFFAQVLMDEMEASKNVPKID